MLTQKKLPQDVTLGVLLVVLLASAFVVVLPSLQALRAMPQHYYNLLPVASMGDVDRDGIPDSIDTHPYGHRLHAAAGEMTETGAVLSTEEGSETMDAMEADEAMEDSVDL